MNALTVLVVDDSPDDREAIRRTLERAEGVVIDVVEVATLGEAQSALLDREFDCVLLDYHLPDTRGTDAVRRLAELCPDTPIVMITGQGDETVAAAAFRSGAADYLGKAVLTNELVVDRILNLIAAREEDEADEFRTVRVLVVDDSPDDRELFARTLMAVRSHRYHVNGVGTGPEAMQSVDDNPPDCIVLDYALPGMNGLQLLARFRKTHPTLPVVLVTGHGSEAIAADALKAGAQGYLPKSAVNREDLHRSVQASMRQFQQMRRMDAAQRHLDQLAKEARQANEEFEQFLMSISHDLRAPLRPLQTLPGWLAQTLGSALGQVPKTVSDSLELMRSHMGRIESMLERLGEHTSIGAAIERRVAERTRELASLNRELSDTVRQRDLLLGEVYHRVKNNLQFVDAMLAVEAHDVDDPVLTDAFQRVRRRMISIGLVHQRILESPDLATLGLDGFVEDLCRHLAEGFDMAGRGIALKTDVAPIAIDLDRAVPLGLVINELVSNAIKHAFPDGRTGTVTVRLAQTASDTVTLEVADDGVGLSPSEVSRTRSGTQILEALVGQLRGSLAIDGHAGTCVIVQMAAWK
ncbi:MAG: response regulator [Rhodospirillaceae bacterium]|nr:response regulator [Rhodospirillaceae bacterium]